MVPWGRQLSRRLSVPGHSSNRQPITLSPHLSYPLTATPQFLNCPAPIRDRVLGLFLAGEDARKEATTGQTQDERDRSWRRWCLFLNEIGIHDDSYLESFDQPWPRTLLISAFAQAMREASYSPSRYTSLAEGTIRSAVDHVAQAFRANNRPDPRQDDGGRLSYVLQQQYRGYKNQDTNVVQQKALPLSVLRKLHSKRSTIENIAIAQLCIGAIFFAMRSCEYLRTTADEEKRRTNILKLKNIRFFSKGQIILHNHPDLALSDTVTVTFEFQKSDERNESVTMHRSGDPTLCPVISWASIGRRILSYPGCNDNTTVNTIFTNGKSSTISSATVRVKLRSAAREVGEAILGFKPDDIGTHSIRSGGAMAMYLAQIPTFTIMMIGRWSSDAFLRYIRRQVEQFSLNVSSKMLRHESYFTTPDFQPTVSRHDTRMPDDPRNFATRFVGGGTRTREVFALCV